jgi:hypothetical protein
MWELCAEPPYKIISSNSCSLNLLMHDVPYLPGHLRLRRLQFRGQYNQNPSKKLKKLFYEKMDFTCELERRSRT